MWVKIIIIGSGCQLSKCENVLTQIAHNIISQQTRLDNTKKPDSQKLSGKFSVERKTRFELATPSLARRCSTTELFPHLVASASATNISIKHRRGFVNTFFYFFCLFLTPLAHRRIMLLKPKHNQQSPGHKFGPHSQPLSQSDAEIPPAYGYC